MNRIFPRCLRRRLPSGAFFTLLGLLAQLMLPQPALVQSNTCKSNSNGYTVTVCIAEPGNGATLSGPAKVTATVSGWSSGVAEVVFSLDGQYLLTDVEAPFSFSLPTTSFANGEHTLSASATMHDGFVSAGPPVTLTFSNTSTPAPGPAFTPVAPTAPPAGQSLIVAATGDGAGGENNAALVSQMVDGWDPDVFLYLGDVYEKGTYTEFYNWYGTDTTYYGRLRDVTNPVVGNHEYANSAAPGYSAYWSNVPDYYSYNAGGWHFVALNSTREFGQTDASSVQYKWLLNELSRNKTAACTIAYFHHPVLSVGPQGDTTRLNAMWSQLVQNGVDIVLTGHDHSYQRWAPLDAKLRPSPGGATQFVAGAGGHGVQGPVRTDSRLAVVYGSAANTYGALYFKLNPNGAEYRYVNSAGGILDRGVIPCSGTVDTAPPNAPTDLAATTSDSGHFELAWTPAWDDTGVNGYGIYRDGTLIAKLAAATTRYEDLNAGLAVTHSYQVDAVDLGGRRSAKSNTATISRSAQASLIFTPIADAYVHSDNPTTNYGSATTLLTDGSPDMQSFLRFALRGVNGRVTGATLRMFARSSSITGYEVHPVTTGEWTESGVTYDTRPATGDRVSTSGPFDSDGVWTEADVTPLVTGNGQIAIALKSTGATAINMSSREGAHPPQLVVNVVADTPPTLTPADTRIATRPYTPAPEPSKTPTPQGR